MIIKKAAIFFSYVSLEERVPRNHPLRKMRRLIDEALINLDELFDELYATGGRPSIPPERLIRASLLQVLYSIRSERQLMEQMDYNLLFRWFVGLGVDDPVWNASTFSKNRDRLVQADVGRRLFEEIVDMARRHALTSDEHFSVDGTLIAAWASHKSVRRKEGSDDDDSTGGGRNAERDFHGEKRSNDTHASRTDPQARLAAKGTAKGARPSYAGHTLMESRNGLLVNAELMQATGRAERYTAIAMATALKPGATVGADKAYDTRDFVMELPCRSITPHVARNTARRGGSAIDHRTTRHPGYALSQGVRKRIEEPFGWAKQIGGLAQTKFRGLIRVRQDFLRVMSAYNLLRMSKLLASPGG